MWLSTRAIRAIDDCDWVDHIEFLGLSHLYEVRSIDSWCNPHVGYSKNFRLQSLEEVWDLLDWLPSPIDRQYHLFFVDASKQKIPEDHPRLKLLGYDLSNKTGKSSLLNYRPWKGVLAPFAERLNEFGLLSWEDARAAQATLPEVWSNDPHSFVKIWALFEVLSLS